MPHTSLLASAIAVAMVGLPGKAFAQASSDASEQSRASTARSGPISEILVTARKREESLLDVPLAVSAVTSEDIEARQLGTLANVAAYIPGLAIAGNANQRSDRAAQTVIVRGITPNSASSNATPTAGVFIDGAPVAGSGFVSGIHDLERVEVLRGPQSTYFGRSVFAGAVNLVTRAPASEFSGSAEGSYGAYGATDNRLSVEGPLAGDALRFRLSGRYFSRDGNYDNNSPEGGRLGDQSTRSISGVLYAEPTPDFSAKLFVLGWQDKDGPSATSKVRRVDYNCNAGAAPAGTNNYFCGTLRTLPDERIGINFPPQVVDFLTNNTAGLFDPIFRIFNNSAGLERRAIHSHLALNYTFPESGLTLSSLTGYDRQRFQTVFNSVQEDLSIPNPVFNPTGPFPYPAFLLGQQNRIDNRSQEIRLTTDGERAVRGLVGASYFEAENDVYTFGYSTNGPAVFQQSAPIVSKTTGVFGSVSFDFGDGFTFTAEGRYQTDKVSLENRAGDTVLSTSFKNFVPRATLQYDLGQQRMVYLNISRGINPGTFNASIVNQPQSTLDFLAAEFGAGPIVETEELTSYEIGFKGQFLDGALQVVAAAYYAQWRDQIISDFLVFPLPSDPSITNVLRPLSNFGETDLWGVELELIGRPTDRLTLGFAGAWNDTEIKRSRCGVCQTLTGSLTVNGNSLSNVPKYNGALTAEWRDTLGATGFDWYSLADFTFASGIWESFSNLSRSEAPRRFNLRVGAENDRYLVEAYLLNAFNNDAPTSVTQATDLARPPDVAINLGLPLLREYGIRARVRF